jgi:hypothetical protein
MMKTYLDVGDMHALRGQEVRERSVRTLDRRARNLTLGRTGLIRRDGEQKARVLQGMKATHDAGQELELVWVKRRRDDAELGIAHDVHERAVAIEKDAATRAGHDSRTSSRSR